MTKRLLSVALAVLMVLALVPMSVLAQASDADDTYQLTVSLEAPETVANPEVNDTLDVYVCISENSGLESGQFAVEFNHDYLEVSGYNSTFSGGVYRLATTAYNNGTSDKFGCTAPTGDAMNYQGQTGGNPFGVAGHWYANFLCGVTTYEYDGCQVGGRLMRIRFKWTDIPTSSMTLNWNTLIVDACVDADTGKEYTAGNVHAQNATTQVTVPSNTHDVTFSIPAIPEQNVTVGKTFTMYFDISEASSLYSGQVIIEYDANYLQCTGYGDETWEDGITGIYDLLVGDDEDPGTDRPGVAVNPAYNGNTGAVPVGETGHTYFNIGLSLTSFDGYNGVQLGGHLTYGTFKWKAVPSVEDLLADENGYYLPLTMTVIKCKYYVTAGSSAEYDNVTAISGKVYVANPEMPTTSYTVIFKDWDGTVLSTQTVEAGASAVAPADPTREGYTFTGWDADFTNVQGDLTVNAQYQINQYTITYYVDGAAVHTDTYNYGADVTAYTYTPAEGYTFSGWVETIPATMPAQNLEIHGTTTANQYTITYYVDGEVVHVDTYAYGATVTPYIYTPAEGYTFSGWTEAIPATMPAQNLEIHGTTEALPPATHTIYYYVDGELFTTQTYAEGETISAPDFPVPTGYSFSGWVNLPAQMGTEDVYIYATTAPIEYTITIYILRYSEALEDWVALADPITITAPYGTEYNVADQIPETYGDYVLVEVIGATAGTVTGDIEIDAHYAIPYEPVPPALTASEVALRERQTEDGKKDVRFIFTVTLNDSCVDFKGELVGPTTEYFEVTGFGSILNAGNGNVTMVGKSIYKMYDLTFQFTTVVTGITSKNFDKVITATPYLTYEMNGAATTVNGNAIEASVNSLMN